MGEADEKPPGGQSNRWGKKKVQLFSFSEEKGDLLHLALIYSEDAVSGGKMKTNGN